MTPQTYDTMSQKTKVVKFGGQMLTTKLNEVRNQWGTILFEIDRLLSDVESDNLVWVVMSATLGTTRRLDQIASLLHTGSNDLAKEELLCILTEHRDAGLILTDQHQSDVNSAFIRLNDFAEFLFGEIREKGFVPNDFLHAGILSLGERMVVELMAIPALNDLRPHIYTAHESALRIMSAYVQGQGATMAKVNVEESVGSIKKTIDELLFYGNYGVDKKALIPTPRIFVMEGYIAYQQGRERPVTLGYDASDLSAVLCAHALGTEAVLIKNIKADQPIPATLPELLIVMRRVSGSKGRLVGIAAIECAIQLGVTIVLRDPMTGDEYRITPSRVMEGVSGK